MASRVAAPGVTTPSTSLWPTGAIVGASGPGAGRRSMSVHRRVAVIEDDAAGRDLMREVLRDAGFCVRAVDSPPALPPSWHGDTIVMDTFGPLFDEAVTSSAIATLAERYHAAVVLVTAHHRAKAAVQALGADAVVLKPYDIDDLVATVSNTRASEPSGDSP